MIGYKYYSDALVTKLQGIMADETNHLFADVQIGRGAKLAGYPAAVVDNEAGSAKVQDTARNEREWLFTIILVHQFNAEVQESEAIAALNEVVDATLTSFDTDIDLNNTCTKLLAQTAKFSYGILSEPFVFAELSISVVAMVQKH